MLVSSNVNQSSIFQHGGWYADTDTVFFGPLTTKKPRDDALDFPDSAEIVLTGTENEGKLRLTNCLFRAQRGSKLLLENMSIYAKDFLKVHREVLGINRLPPLYRVRFLKAIRNISGI